MAALQGCRRQNFDEGKLPLTFRKNVPLNALRTFEVAARYESFTAAAEELGVTQVAVSRQVKALEEYLEVPLFKRGHQSLALTQQGAQLQPVLNKSLDDIYRIVEKVSLRGRSDVVNVQAYTTFAQRWLIPKLTDFNLHHPTIEVRVSASLAPVDFKTQSIDFAIRSGKGPMPDCDSLLLAPIILTPVCTREYAERVGLKSASDLRNATLLHSLARHQDWSTWLAQQGESVERFGNSLRFENSALAYEAAIHGLGVAMGLTVLTEELVRKHVFVEPFSNRVAISEGYYLNWPNQRSLKGALLKFRDWTATQALPDPVA